MSGVGWGAGAWGGIPWGSGPGTLALAAAVAARENVVQLVFSRPIYFSGVLDTPDASNPALYGVRAVAGTVGLDGNAVRPVSVVSADLEQGVAANVGLVLNLSLDRPMTPYPAQYVVTVRGVYAADLSSLIDPNPVSLQFFSVFKNVQQPAVSTPTPARDFANPQTLSALTAIGADPNDAALGSFVADDTGDYAFDSGVPGFKKRMYRRITSAVGGFLHLGQRYGVGIKDFGKKLASASNRGLCSAKIEEQVSREPEAQRVRANIVPTSKPGLYRVQLLVKFHGGLAMRYDVPVVAHS